mmetsp:Transcript_22346/g.33014  ORF Transcript_22346/g.33014 Transcript_22346/m.33014 type:complete len:201 (+) Transcript_22346:533-1135(+)
MDGIASFSFSFSFPSLLSLFVLALALALILVLVPLFFSTSAMLMIIFGSRILVGGMRRPRMGYFTVWVNFTICSCNSALSPSFKPLSKDSKSSKHSSSRNVRRASATPHSCPAKCAYGANSSSALQIPPPSLFTTVLSPRRPYRSLAAETSKTMVLTEMYISPPSALLVMPLNLRRCWSVKFRGGSSSSVGICILSEFMY